MSSLHNIEFDILVVNYQLKSPVYQTCLLGRCPLSPPLSNISSPILNCYYSHFLCVFRLNEKKIICHSSQTKINFCCQWRVKCRNECCASLCQFDSRPDSGKTNAEMNVEMNVASWLESIVDRSESLYFIHFVANEILLQ